MRALAFGGEDLAPWADPFFRSLPAGPAVLLSFAVAEYGAGMVEKLRGAGVARLQRVEREARVLESSTRADFDSAESLRALEGAGSVYLQGGNPRTIAASLGGSRFWIELRSRALTLVTTSGGAMSLGARCPDVGPLARGWSDGLALFSNALLAAHWDSFHLRDPQFRSGFEAEAARIGATLFAIDDAGLLELDGAQLRARGNVSKLIGGAWSRVS